MCHASANERVDIWPIRTILSAIPLFPYPAVDPMQTSTLISTYPHSGGRAFILINTQWISHPRNCFRDPPTAEYRK